VTTFIFFLMVLQAMSMKGRSIKGNYVFDSVYLNYKLCPKPKSTNSSVEIILESDVLEEAKCGQTELRFAYGAIGKDYQGIRKSCA